MGVREESARKKEIKREKMMEKLSEEKWKLAIGGDWLSSAMTRGAMLWMEREKRNERRNKEKNKNGL